MTIHTTPDSNSWYRRHIERDNEIHKLIGDSQYGQRVLYSTAKGGIKSAVGITAGVLVGTLGIIVGGVIVYGGIKGNSGEIAAAGIAVMIFGVQKGYEIGRNSVKSSLKTAKIELDLSDRYRYVRYLPDQAFVIFGKGEHPLRVTSGNKSVEMKIDIANSTKISIRYLPY
jgi:hypothetical protein